MDPESFVRWALDDARTLEERYTTELLVERGVYFWNSQRRIFKSESFEETIERKRQRALNPAYEPHYSAESLERAYEGWGRIIHFGFDGGLQERPVRSFAPLRFFPWAEYLQVGSGCEVDDLSPLADLPKLKLLHLRNATCMDYRPLARCRALDDLHLHLGRNWPCVEGIGDLPALKTLKLHGNLLVFDRMTFPNVISAVIECLPLSVRSVRDLPQLPKCQFLQLAGTETLDGIERFSELRNLTVDKPFDSFEPLTALQHLTCLTVLDHEPIDLKPLARIPKLQFLALDTWNRTRIHPVKPRDVSVLVDSASLRELFVRGNKIIETEAAAVQAGLPSWYDLYQRDTPRELPPLKMRAVPFSQVRSENILPKPPDEPAITDLGLRNCEFRWAQKQLFKAISKKLGTSDWGEAEAKIAPGTFGLPVSPEYKPRYLSIEFHAFGLLDKYPLVIEAIRECLAWFKHDYRVQVWNQLKAPRLEPTPAQKELQKKFEREQDDASFERLVEETQEYMERLHRYELKKQVGEKVDPAEFAPGPRKELPTPPWEKDGDEDDGADDGGDIAVKEKPEPPPMYLDDEHPLADKYTLMAELTFDTFWIPVRQRGVAEYLMGRPCDEVIEEPKQEGT
jgi:hypothetical protein